MLLSFISIVAWSLMMWTTYCRTKEPPKLNTDFNKIMHYKQGARDFASYLKINDEKLNQFYEKVDKLII